MSTEYETTPPDERSDPSASIPSASNHQNIAASIHGLRVTLEEISQQTSSEDLMTILSKARERIAECLQQTRQVITDSKEERGSKKENWPLVH